MPEAVNKSIPVDLSCGDAVDASIVELPVNVVFVPEWNSLGYDNHPGDQTSAESIKRWRQWVKAQAQIQWGIYDYIRQHPDYGVCFESQPRDDTTFGKPEYGGEWTVAELQRGFPVGIPANFSQLTFEQRRLFAAHGACRAIMAFLREIEFIGQWRICLIFMKSAMSFYQFQCKN